MTAIIIAAAQTMVISLVIWYWQRAQNKRDKENNKLEELRKQEARLQMQLLFSAGQLAFGCAVALERGSTNGEIKEAKQSFEEASENYKAFLETEALNKIHEV